FAGARAGTGCGGRGAWGLALGCAPTWAPNSCSMRLAWSEPARTGSTCAWPGWAGGGGGAAWTAIAVAGTAAGGASAGISSAGLEERPVRRTTAPPVKRARPRSGSQPGVRGSSAGRTFTGSPVNASCASCSPVCACASWAVLMPARDAATPPRSRGEPRRTADLPVEGPAPAFHGLEVRGEEDAHGAHLGPRAGQGEREGARLAVEAEGERARHGGPGVPASGPRDLEQVAALREARDLQRLAARAGDVTRDDRRLDRRPEPGDAPPLRVDQGEVE